MYVKLFENWNKKLVCVANKMFVTVTRDIYCLQFYSIKSICIFACCYNLFCWSNWSPVIYNVISNVQDSPTIYCWSYDLISSFIVIFMFLVKLITICLVIVLHSSQYTFHSYFITGMSACISLDQFFLYDYNN